MHLHLLSFISVFFDTDAMTDLDIQELANLTAADGDVDNFERLFTKLKEMKGNDGNEKKKNEQKTACFCLKVCTT